MGLPEGTVPIPGPPGLPFIGNAKDINPSFPLGSLVNFSELYGEIYRMNMVGTPLNVVSTNALVNEVCDEKRFGKKVNTTLEQIRHGVHDGLFTAKGEEEPNWGIAHRVLMPAFGPVSIRGMFDEMHDIASQLALKWARYGSNEPIHVTDDFTRLTLDTLALCAMDFRFNSYYKEEMHPFIGAMGDFLTESGNRARRPPLPSIFYRQADQKYELDIDVLRKTAEEVLEQRKKHPNDRKDFLNAMLSGKDPKTGERMSDSSIMDNLITFLIAGHETTSGLLSFAFYELLKHPEAYRRAQQEVDEVIGTGSITVEHMTKLPYIAAILRETLRLCSPITIFSVKPNQDEIIGGKYLIPAGETILCLLARAHLDPVVYGDDAREFKPERMLDGPFEEINKKFPNCWKPFGNGMRACIGRPFAWQEAILVMAMLLQNFNFQFDDPQYQLSLKQTLTIKPNQFFMRATLRRSLTPTQLEHNLSGVGAISTTGPQSTSGESQVSKTDGQPLSIYYGSNSGTCEALAQRLATDAQKHGFQAVTVDTLDSANQKVPEDQPVVIFTASYEGQPPDNARLFVKWIESLQGKQMGKVKYAVFGCGHHDWASTFHRIPKLVDSKLEALGGTRIAPLGLSDAGNGDMFTDFESWEDQVFWPAMKEIYGASLGNTSDPGQPTMSVDVTAPRKSTLRQDVSEAIVVQTKNLTAPDVPSKKHIEIKLPSDMTYSAGDYLAILPINPKETVQRAMRRFQLAWDSHLVINASGPTLLPTNASIPAADVFGAYVELSLPATKRNVALVAAAAEDSALKEKLEYLADKGHATEISAKHVSVLDILEQFPTIALPLPSFLEMLPPMRVRQYSISSSPLWKPNHVTLTYAVVDEPSFAAPESKRHIGVASNYLASLQVGDRLHVSVRPSHTSFHLPSNPETVPVMLVAAGTGLAPFRGFIQERAAQIAAGRTLADCVLWFGCRYPDKDSLYKEELDKWEAMGAVTVRRAFSRVSEASDGCKYVQDRILKDRDMVIELWKKSARVYVCGNSDIGEAMRDVAIKLHIQQQKELHGSDLTEEEAKEWFEGIRNVRYATDVFT